MNGGERPAVYTISCSVLLRKESSFQVRIDKVFWLYEASSCEETSDADVLARQLLLGGVA